MAGLAPPLSTARYFPEGRCCRQVRVRVGVTVRIGLRAANTNPNPNPNQVSITLTLTRYKSLEWVGSNALWQVQATNGINTDPVAPGCGYCLQHLPSGKYLAVESGAASPANAAAGGGAP